jgi:hypothetical protein
MTNRRRKRSGGRNLTVYEAQERYLTQISVHRTHLFMLIHTSSRARRASPAPLTTRDTARAALGPRVPPQLPHTPRRYISTAIQTADAQTILNAASARMLRVSFGVM